MKQLTNWTGWDYRWFYLNAGMSAGVFWTVWGKVGFWHGVLYGLFWEAWLAWRLGEWLTLRFWR